MVLLAGAPGRARTQTVAGASPAAPVVIDAGHGGSRPGMRARLPNGSTIDEKVITLGIANKLAAALRKRGSRGCDDP